MSDGIISVFFSPTLAKILATLARRARARLQAERASSGRRRDEARLAQAAPRHVALIAVLFGLQFVLPAYHHLMPRRASWCSPPSRLGYNILFGYAGLLSLGHAMFFAAGLYGAGLTAYHLGWEAPAAFLAGVSAALVLAFLVGLVALRTSGVAFMIVTMMFAQACYLLDPLFRRLYARR